MSKEGRHKETDERHRQTLKRMPTTGTDRYLTATHLSNQTNKIDKTKARLTQQTATHLSLSNQPLPTKTNKRGPTKTKPTPPLALSKPKKRTQC
jgi:hypothetical protein